MDHENVLFRVVRIGLIKNVDAHLDPELLALIDLPVVGPFDALFCLYHPAPCSGDKAAFRLKDIGPYELQIIEAFGGEELFHLLHRGPPVIVVAAR